MQISARHQDKTTIFDLSGDIDFANSPEVRQSVLREIRESRTPRVVVNLRHVRYIDSSGVATLVEGLKASRDLRSRFILFGLSTSAREVLQLSRLIKGRAAQQVLSADDSRRQTFGSGSGPLSRDTAPGANHLVSLVSRRPHRLHLQWRGDGNLRVSAMGGAAIRDD